MPKDEFRSRSRRINGKWDVVARGASVVVKGDVMDLSTTGFYFQVAARLSVGQRIAADIATSPDETIRAVVEIVREEVLGDGQFGYGARFAAMTEVKGCASAIR